MCMRYALLVISYVAYIVYEMARHNTQFNPLRSPSLSSTLIQVNMRHYKLCTTASEYERDSQIVNQKRIKPRPTRRPSQPQNLV